MRMSRFPTNGVCAHRSTPSVRSTPSGETSSPSTACKLAGPRRPGQTLRLPGGCVTLRRSSSSQDRLTGHEIHPAARQRDLALGDAGHRGIRVSPDPRGAGPARRRSPAARAADDQPVGAIAVLQDASHLERAEWDRWSYNAVRFLVLALVISVIIALIVKFSITRPMAEISQWTRALRSGRPVPPPRNVSDANMFGPLALEVSRLARSMQRAQAAAEQEAALRLSGESIWTEQRLKQFVQMQMDGRRLGV